PPAQPGLVRGLAGLAGRAPGRQRRVAWTLRRRTGVAAAAAAGGPGPVAAAGADVRPAGTAVRGRGAVPRLGAARPRPRRRGRARCVRRRWPPRRGGATVARGPARCGEPAPGCAGRRRVRGLAAALVRGAVLVPAAGRGWRAGVSAAGGGRRGRSGRAPARTGGARRPLAAGAARLA